MKTTTTFLVALGITLSLAPPAIRAADQPKPGPEHKKLEVFVGDWTYEGYQEATPFFPAAGAFKGKSVSRMVLGGFFVEGRDEDKADDGYVYQGVGWSGYDPVKKTYFTHTFENDGKANVGSLMLSGNSWTSYSTRSDSKGKVYKTRNVQTFAADGKSWISLTEYSSDNGKTWKKAWSVKATKVGQ